MTNSIEKIYAILNKTLRELGVNYTDIGFPETIFAVRLAWEDEENLNPMNKKIYDVIARERERERTAVESAIRQTARKCWEHDKSFFIKYDETLLTTPSNKRFLEILLRDLHKKLKSSQ